MPTQREKIIRKTLEILESRPEGIRYSGLFREIKNSLPEVPENTIHGTIWDLDKRAPQVVAKPERGLFILKKHLQERMEKGLKSVEKKFKMVEKIIQKEENFYQPFADYLVNDLEECTKAIPLGGGTNSVINGEHLMFLGYINFQKQILYAPQLRLSVPK